MKTEPLNSENTIVTILQKLRLKWLFTAFCGLIMWLSAFLWLRTWWESPYYILWLFPSSLVLSYLLWLLWSGLKDNHRLNETELLPSLGLGNLLSIGRGFILAIFCGFLLSPWPDVGWKAWLPGLLYTFAALPDFLDGVAARLTNHVTKLGETLDVSIDSIGVLGVSLLAVQYGQVPWWYLLVGLARYIFLTGIWLRRKRHLPVYDLPYSVRRRGYAALTMGLFFVILYPVFSPPGTHYVAAVFAIYLLGGFIWDWFLTIGWLPPKPGPGYLRLENIIVRDLPLGLRLILLFWFITSFWPDTLSGPGSSLRWIEAFVILCLILGIAGRINAIAALMILGLYQTTAPLSPLQFGLILLYANLLFLGTGALSLWPVENQFIFHRVGEQRESE